MKFKIPFMIRSKKTTIKEKSVKELIYLEEWLEKWEVDWEMIEKLTEIYSVFLIRF